MTTGVVDAGIAVAWIRRGQRSQAALDRLYTACRDRKQVLWISAVNLAEVVIHTH